MLFSLDLRSFTDEQEAFQRLKGLWEKKAAHWGLLIFLSMSSLSYIDNEHDPCALAEGAPAGATMHTAQLHFYNCPSLAAPVGPLLVPAGKGQSYFFKTCFQGPNPLQRPSQDLL